MTTAIITLPLSAPSDRLHRTAVAFGGRLVAWGSTRRARSSAPTYAEPLLRSTQAAAVRAGMLPR